MIHGLESAGEFFSRLASASSRVLMTDYDGTLAPFREMRSMAMPLPGAMQLLGEAAAAPRSRVVIVTGRSVEDLLSVTSDAGAFEIFGEHGMQRKRPGEPVETEDPGRTARDALASAKSILHSMGLVTSVEAKATSVAVHFRGLDAKDQMRIFESVMATLDPIASAAGMLLSGFDGGVELKAASRNKGDAVKAVKAEEPACALFAYMGDDLTDEDAFKALGPDDLGVLVGSRNSGSHASMKLDSPGQVLEFLSNWVLACGRRQ